MPEDMPTPKKSLKEIEKENINKFIENINKLFYLKIKK